MMMFKVKLSICNVIAITLAIAITFISPLIAQASADPAGEELSQGQKNIILRARQVLEIEWTAMREIEAWGSHKNFKEGEVYKGIPYGMPANPVNYVPYGTSFEVFLEAAADPDSLMYTSNATRTTLAPYYSLDCSAFLSWVWDLDTLHKTWDLHLVADRIGSDIEKIETGDALNKPSDHVILISHVGYDDDGKVNRIETMELTGPIAKHTCYGEGENISLSSFKRIYLQNGYVILRYKERDSVEYIHDCLVPVDNDFCPYCIKSDRVWHNQIESALKAPVVKINTQLTRRVPLLPLPGS